MKFAYLKPDRPKATHENIRAQIGDAVMLAQCRGDIPKSLYLGRLENACLDLALFPATKVIENGRRVYDGLEIFVVDAPSHLRVGCEP